MGRHQLRELEPIVVVVRAAAEAMIADGSGGDDHRLRRRVSWGSVACPIGPWLPSMASMEALGVGERVWVERGGRQWHGR